jgi:hypothetical protein
MSRSTAAGLLSALLATSLAAQDAGTLRVSVVDPTSASVPRARVVLRGTRGTETRAVTDAEGRAEIALPPGRYRVRVELDGFEPVDRDVRVSAGVTELTVPLTLARRVEEVEVAEESDASRGRTFSNVLTPAEIAQLPDDPDEMEEVLRQMAGPGAVLRVNGFAGGRLPPKSQIRQIRFSRNPYAAENHEGGMAFVDITTQPGLGAWRRTLGLGLRAPGLNAAPALADGGQPGSYGRAGVALDGPLVRGRTSLSLAIEGRRTVEPRPLTATLPGGPRTDVLRSTLDRADVTARVEHALGLHTLRAEYQRLGRHQDNLGAGGLDLPERAFTEDRTEQLLRLADSGVLAERLVTETRLQLRWEETGRTPESTAPAIVVSGGFTAGGASPSGTRRVRELYLAEDVDASFGRHALRAGIRVESGRYRSDEVQNGNGTFLFPDLQAFAAGRPTLYTRREGTPEVAFGQTRVGAYLQDDIRASGRLALNLGVRYEAQSRVPDRANLAPRAALAWTVNTRTTLRARAGVFFDWLDAEVDEQARRLDGTRQAETLVVDPGFPDPGAGSGAVASAPGVLRLADDLQLPEVRRASVGVEWVFSQRLRVSVDATAASGRRRLRGRNLNPFVPGEGRPDPKRGNVVQVESTGGLSRQGLHVHLHAGSPLSRASLLLSYQLSRTTNDADGAFSLPADPGRPELERGPAPDDVRHALFALGNWRPARGLRATAMLQARSGVPYDVLTGRDDNGDTVANDRPAGTPRNSARGRGVVELGLRLTWSRSFGPRRTAGPPEPRLVRIDPGSSDGPPDLPSPDDEGRRFRLSVHAQALNVLNRTNGLRYGGVLGSPSFGRPTAAAPPRRLELGASLAF